MGGTSSSEQSSRRGQGPGPQGSSSGEARQRVRRVRVTGAGLPEANGVYLPMQDFAGAEAFQLQVNKGGFNKIYIRRRADEVHTWVISTSPYSDASGDHLYKRECDSRDQITPPLFCWTPCTTSDGVPGGRATKLLQGSPKLKYHYGPLSDINWDCEPPQPGQSDESHGRPPRPTGVSSSLVVCAIGANNLPLTRARQFHVACQVPGKHEIIESVPVPACQDPEFKLKTPLQSWKRPDSLQFTLFAERNIKIGAAELQYEYFAESGFVGELPVTLFGSDSQEVTLDVCVTMPGQPTPGIDVEIQMTGNSKIGIEIAPDTMNNCLVVNSILEAGLIAQWNYDNPDQTIRIRDKIVEIDGASGSCRAMLMKLTREEPRSITMRVQRAGT